MKKKVLLIVAIIVCLSLVVLTVLGLIKYFDGKKEVININGISYTKNDYMMYLRSAKNMLFDENTTRLPKATLNTIVDSDTNLTTEEYLKQKTEENLKIAGAVEKIATDNDISLSFEEEEELEKQKQEFITSLGSKLKFYKFLYDNKTSDEAYDKIARLEMLYSKVYDELYAEGKVNDLTEKETKDAKKTYELEYKHAKQIFLVTVNPETKEKLSSSLIEQKKLLAKSIRAEINEDSDFDEYIKKYSDDAINSDGPYDMYFKSSQMLEEIEDTVNELQIGQISDVVESKYGYHIIKREPLDDGYFEKYLDSKRENKYLLKITDVIKDSKIIIQDSFTTLKVG